ncbi:gamma-glutamyl-gamma-aminobutyrate hydrolase family protein [Candidatus Cyanaurora vandensis]|uniref:gamma-glutamyl-gamma-aminobutyrate hydrolase family protein n=1 Tax=Candidatus Cyanaurora vandensis TaxID=2714958 RepID=UPI002580DD82|nr:gamma-glutamyl-gamma-aminobutyrate hydrolase family protein [Candidatus Cyanaurora vandensis]
MSHQLRLGISISLAYPDQDRALFRGKTLQYVEEQLVLGVARHGAVPVPLVDLKSDEGAYRVLWGLDGLLLSGGADVSPGNYGEDPLNPAWVGDPVRDAYELRLVKAAREQHLPILGICRGAQLLNVALGGTLYQDITTQVTASLLHRCPERYDRMEHRVHLKANSWLSTLYPEADLVVNTVHHQAVKTLAPGLTLAAQAPDGVCESFERINEREWLVGIQWHPEWLDGQDHRVDGNRVLKEFLQVCHRRTLLRSALTVKVS